MLLKKNNPEEHYSLQVVTISQDIWENTCFEIYNDLHQCSLQFFKTQPYITSRGRGISDNVELMSQHNCSVNFTRLYHQLTNDGTVYSFEWFERNYENNVVLILYKNGQQVPFVPIPNFDHNEKADACIAGDYLFVTSRCQILYLKLDECEKNKQILWTAIDLDI